MTPSAALDLLRAELGDEVRPYLWSDDYLYSCLDDAQKMFCRLTDGIADASTNKVTLLDIPVDTDWVKLHASILKIRSAYLVSTGGPIEIINGEDMPGRALRFDGTTGPVARLVEGLEENKIRAHPVASVADSIRLSVFRLPLTTITGASGEAFELGEHHHPHLPKWAKHRAYGVQDADARDEKLAQKFENEFRNYCALAQQEQRTKRHKVRTVVYGGI